MRILILSQWYSPEPARLIASLANWLVQRGHQVTSITGFPNYPGGNLYPGYTIRWRQWEERDGVRILRVPLYPDHSRSGLKRILNYLSFAVSASFLGPILANSADVMWVYHPPLTVGLPALCISIVRRIPFIYEVQDLWPETLGATGMVHSSIAFKIVDLFAKLVYHQATAIVVISPGFKQNLVNKGVLASKIHVIPNWADDEIYRPVPRDESLGRKHGLSGKFNVIFAGNIGVAQALDTVLDAAAYLSNHQDIQFVFIGDGIETPRLVHLAQERGLKNVIFIDRQPAERMPHFFAWAGALLVHLKRDPLFEITIPSKIISYLACGRPIICAVPGDAADVVRSAKAGITCSPEDSYALANKVREIAEMPMEQREAMGQAGRTAFLANYTRAHLMRQHEKLLEHISANPQYTKHMNRKDPV